MPSRLSSSVCKGPEVGLTGPGGKDRERGAGRRQSQVGCRRVPDGFCLWNLVGPGEKGPSGRKASRGCGGAATVFWGWWTAVTCKVLHLQFRL